MKNLSILRSMIFLLMFYNPSMKNLKRHYDTLNIDNITPQIEDTCFTGGITEIGSFMEGFSFKVDSEIRF